MKKIKLWRSPDDPKVFNEGDYAGDGNGATWVLTQYSESPCSGECKDDPCEWVHASKCIACGDYIDEMSHFLCMDGGDSAHDNYECVIVHAQYPHSTGTLYDCLACDMPDVITGAWDADQYDNQYDQG